jgi:hypothetical protein
MLLLILELSDLDYAVKLRSNSSGNVYERKVEDGWFVNPPWIKISGWALALLSLCSTLFFCGKPSPEQLRLGAYDLETQRSVPRRQWE